MAKMFRVYSVIQRPKQEDYWLNIGAALPHEDGEGFNLLLQALPLHGNGKLVMRAYDGAAQTGSEEALEGRRARRSVKLRDRAPSGGTPGGALLLRGEEMMEPRQQYPQDLPETPRGENSSSVPIPVIHKCY